MKYCPKCGASLNDDAVICPLCGEVQHASHHEKNYDQPVEQTYVVNKQTNNIFAILGLIFAFVQPILGVVFSIVGLNKSKKMNGLGRNMSIAGIIVGIFMYIACQIVINVWLMPYIEQMLEELKEMVVLKQICF